MKYIIYITALFVLFHSASASSTLTKDERLSKTAKFNTMAGKLTKSEFKSRYGKIQSRVPSQLSNERMAAIRDLNRSNSLKIGAPKAKNLTNDFKFVDLPSDANFPGEFEEIQAALITWGYIALDTNDNETEQFFDGIGFYGDNDLGPVYGVIDTFPSRELCPVFRDLAYAINQNAQVWINLWYPEDTTAVLNYMKNQGKPLTNYKFFFHPGNTFWYRDCGPVAYYYGKDDNIGWVDFQYYSGRPLDDSIPIQIGRELGYNVVTNTIGYEGGNILLDGRGNLFTSDEVYEGNSVDYGQYYIDENGELNETTKEPLSKTEVEDSLRKYLNLSGIHIYPKLKYDGGTGHIDLYADLYDQNRFVYTNYPSEMASFTDAKTSKKNIDSMMAIVRTEGDHYYKRYITLPRKNNGNWYSSSTDYKSYTRSYSNHLMINKAIIQPVFTDGIKGDTAHYKYDMDTLRMSYPGYNIIPVDVSSFDGWGGALHCITKQIPAENPIKIYHNDLHDTLTAADSYAIKATITNKSGIGHAECIWRVAGGQWQSLPMTNEGNDLFNAYLQNPIESGTIEYYISATSNNGKTITKPIVAPDGIYKFYVSGSTPAIETANSGIGEFYPQPATESARIDLNGVTGAISMEVFNSNGNIAYSKSFVAIDGDSSIEVNTGLLPQGAYIVSFRFGNETITRKLTIVR